VQRGHLQCVNAGPRRRLLNCQCRVRRRQDGDGSRQLVRHPRGLVSLEPLLKCILLAPGQDVRQGLPKRVHSIGKLLNSGADVDRMTPVVDHPASGTLHEGAHLHAQCCLHLRADPMIKCSDGLIEISGAVDRASGDLCPDHVGSSGPGLRRQSVEAGDARLVHELVDHNRGNDLPVQPVPSHLVGVALSHQAREVVDQPAFHIRVIGQVRGQDVVLENDFGVGEQRGKLRRGQALVGASPDLHCLGRR
jgi:hypothetical protein